VDVGVWGASRDGFEPAKRGSRLDGVGAERRAGDKERI